MINKNVVVETFESKLASGNTLPGYVCVKFGASAKTVTLGTGTTDAIIGVTLPKEMRSNKDEARILAGTQSVGDYWYESGAADKVSIVTFGRCVAKVGTAGVTLGTPIMCEALTGYVVDHSAGNTVVGFALETATAGNLAEIMVVPVGIVISGYQGLDQVQVASANAAIAKSTVTKGFKHVIITKGSACALTLADPVATTDDYKVIEIVSTTAYNHTVTADFGGSGSLAYTFTANKNDSLTVEAYQGKWYIKGFKKGCDTQELTGDAAITIKNGFCQLNKAGAIAATIADPLLTDEGNVITITSKTAQAHTVDNSAGSGFNGWGASYDIGTFGGAIHDGMTIKAIGGKWYVVNKTNVTLA